MRHLGKLPPRYRFYLNPYPHMRYTTCPQCGAKTRQRKLPLVIHVNPMQPVALNKTCKYCPHCDLLIVHKDEIEPLLDELFESHGAKFDPNEYLVVGTMDRPVWKRAMATRMTLQEMLDNLHDFRKVVGFKLVYG